MLRLTNEDLSKQVEGLQTSRLNEVEELAYLRWVNSCLRTELKNTCSTLDSDKPSSPQSVVSSTGDSIISFSDQCGNANSFNLVKKLKKWPITSSDNLSQVESTSSTSSLFEKNWIESISEGSNRRRHSISGSNSSEEDVVVLNKRRQSNCFDSLECLKEIEKESVPLPSLFVQQSVMEKRPLRIPNPPPRPSSCSISSKTKQENSAQVQVQVQPPPPPPPPPPPMSFASKSNTAMVKRAPQVVELYHSLMKRDSRKDSSNGGLADAPDVADVRSSMIGEIENRSSHLLAVSTFTSYAFNLLTSSFFMTKFVYKIAYNIWLEDIVLISMNNLIDI